MTARELKKKMALGPGDGAFTLIELLIVIAILGVLAVVVLLAINPIQQLARTRDAGRISTVTQLGHAVQSYYTTNNAAYPALLADLVTTGEINNIPSLVSNTLNAPVCSGGDDAQNGWCFDGNNTTGDAVVWSRLEADVNLTQGTCTTDAYIAFFTAAGRACIVCAAPTAATNPTTTCQN